MHDDALHGATDLAVAAGEATFDEVGRDRLNVGVGADDCGVVASQLEVDLLHRVGGVAQDLTAGGRAAGHGDQLDAFRPNERGADSLSPACDDLMRGARKARLFHEMRNAQQSERAFLRRLGDDGVAGRERAGRLVRPKFRRIIEGHDRSDNAERATHRDRHRPLEAGYGVEGRDFAEQPLGFLGIAAPDADRRLDFAGRLPASLAVFAGQKLA